MSLYAILPGPSSSSKSQVGYDLVQTVLKEQETVAKEQMIPPPEPKVIAMCNIFNDATMISRSSSFSSMSSMEELDDTANETASLSPSFKTEQDLKVNVEEATINFAKLVRPSSKSSSKKSRRSRATSPRRNRRDFRLQRRTTDSSASSSTSAELDPNARALDFRLVVTFAGRTYCTKRSLQQIAQFREDLLEDMEWAEHFHDSSHQSHGSSISVGLGKSSSTNGSSVLPSLPRIPDVFGGCGGGFAQMQHSVDLYRPALQTWFQEALAVASSDSSVVYDFLWEPLDCSCNIDSLHIQLTKLGIISES